MSNIAFRLRLSLIHLGVSLMIAGIAAAIVFLLWHPAPLAKAVGVTHIFLLMLGIDAVLGPCLTFIVAKQGKKTLKMDLLVIVAIQLSALAYGMYNIAINRPVYIAFDTSRFELVQASDIERSSLIAAEPPYNTLGWGQPKWIAVRPAISTNENTDRALYEMDTGTASTMRPSLYVPLETVWTAILQESKPVAELIEINDTATAEAILAKYPEADKWLPMKAYVEDMAILIDSKKGRIVEIVDLRGWK